MNDLIQSMTQGSGKAVLSCCVSINVLCIVCDLFKSDNKKHLFAQTLTVGVPASAAYVFQVFLFKAFKQCVDCTEYTYWLEKH